MLIIISTITGCVSISGFVSLVGISIGIMSSTIGLKICLINVRIKKYKSINKKNKTKHDKILLVKSQLNSVEVLIFKALNDSNTSHDEFILINNVMKEFYNIEEEVENSNDKYTICKIRLPYSLKCRKNKESKHPKLIGKTPYNKDTLYKKFLY